MVENGVHISLHEATGLQREEFCSHNSKGEWTCIIALVDTSARVFKFSSKSKQKPILKTVMGAF